IHLLHHQRVGAPALFRLPESSVCGLVLTCRRFVSSVCCRASDKCQREKRKTINGDDLLSAMATLGFEYIEPLKVYLQKYREAVRRDNK
uniref:Transcription factor CBF/NF-Y/archaeal histone domain-containing protein n=1 Tax=Triticum urartu TaxID=4572 RepID=A0A8R7UKE4_TRIUA